MTFYNKNAGGFKGKSSFGRKNAGRRTMHKTTCSKCGDTCEVPFVPTGEKPVYCSECFSKRLGHDGDRSSFRKHDARDRSPQVKQKDYQPQFDALHKKLDAIMEMLSVMNQAPDSEPALDTADEKMKVVKKKKAKKKV